MRIGQVLLVAGAAGTLVTALRALGGAAATAFLPDWLRDVLLATGLPLLLMGAVWLRIGRRELRAEQRAAHLRLHGEPARGTVVSIRQRRYLEEELVRVDLVLEVNREGLPSYRASTRLHLLPEETVVYAPGATVAVRVNPDRPSEVIVEHG